MNNENKEFDIEMRTIFSSFLLVRETSLVIVSNVKKIHA